MSENFHSPWVAEGTLFKTAMGLVFKNLDDAITYIHNIIIHFDGHIFYSVITGELSWSGTIRILITNDQGDEIQNTIDSGSIILSDNDMAYVDLSYTDGTELTVYKTNILYAQPTELAISNRLVLAYRNSLSDRVFSEWFDINPDALMQEV